MLMLVQPLAVGQSDEEVQIDSEVMVADDNPAVEDGNMTFDSLVSVSDLLLSEPSESVPDPPPLEVVPVVGEVTHCSLVTNESMEILSVHDNTQSMEDSSDEVSLLDSGTVTVQGRIVYENVLTAESAGDTPPKSLPKSEHNYEPNSNPANGDTWHLYGRPGASQVSMFFPRIETQYPNDYIYIKDSGGSIQWQSQASTYHNEWVTVTGNQATIELYSDASTEMWGFEVTKFVQDQNH